MTDSVAREGLAAGKPRLAFIDNIRWTVIAMVVLMHACVTYGGLGSWYYKEGASLDVASGLVFAAYQTFAQAFFMGLLFFAAAVFTPGAYDRKGFGRFIGDRMVRLGVPTLVYMLLLHPLTMFIREAGLGKGLSPRAALQWYGGYVASGAFVSESGPLWFAFALLVFSLLYGVVRLAASGRTGRKGLGPFAAPVSSGAVHAAAVLLMVVIASGSFLVRLVQPMGTSVLNMQLCYFTQYVALFVLGLWAGRKGLLQSIPQQAGKTWMWLALGLGAPAWFLLMGFGGALSGNLTAYSGGMHWQAAAYAAWEAFFCVSFSVGLLCLYRERVNARTRVTGILTDTSFGIYVFHAPVLVAVTMLMRGMTVHPLAKTLVAAALAWLASLVVALVVRRIPGLRRIFS